MDSSVSPKDEIWFLRVCHHISNAVYPDSNHLFLRCVGRLDVYVCLYCVVTCEWVLWDPTLHKCYLHCVYLVSKLRKDCPMMVSWPKHVKIRIKYIVVFDWNRKIFCLLYSYISFNFIFVYLFHFFSKFVVGLQPYSPCGRANVRQSSSEADSSLSSQETERI